MQAKSISIHKSWYIPVALNFSKSLNSRPLVSESVVEKVRENTDRYIERPLYAKKIIKAIQKQ